VPRCPVCDSPRVIIVLNQARRGLCAACGARWVQDGDTQRQVEAPLDAQRTGAR
jgi:transposase-like protein